MGVAQVFEAGAAEFKRFFPGRFTKDFRPVGSIAVELLQRLRVFCHAELANQRFGKPLRAVGVVKTKPALDTQAAVVGRAVAPVNADDLVVLDVIGQEAADTTKRTD